MDKIKNFFEKRARGARPLTPIHLSSSLSILAIYEPC